MRPRFSIRWLLALITFAAITCGFLVAPTFPARRLVATVNSGDYTELNSIGLSQQLWQFKDEAGKRYPLDALRIEAVLHPRTWRDMLKFRRRVSINIWPPSNAKNVPRQTSIYTFVRVTGAKLGGETWE